MRVSLTSGGAIGGHGNGRGCGAGWERAESSAAVEPPSFTLSQSVTQLHFFCRSKDIIHRYKRRGQDLAFLLSCIGLVRPSSSADLNIVISRTSSC
jgi:hypothetical protein